MFQPIYAANRAAEKGPRARRAGSASPSSGPTQGTAADLLAFATMPRV